MFLPPLPGPRRPVHEVFRIRPAQDTNQWSDVSCTPSCLALHLATRWRRLSQSSSANCFAFECSTCLPEVLRPFGVLHERLLPARFPGHTGRRIFVRFSPLASSEPPCFRLGARPGLFLSPVARLRVPLRALPISPARLVSSRRHPWDFSLQRFDLVLSRQPLGRRCPSFPWLDTLPCRAFRALAEARTHPATGRATASSYSY